ncbi:MAG TPA: hypothetical protein VGR10_05085, partial [Thermoleophilaceae bacterium]|nr:hypothetical protein [Thermoleophilaceae bacterium]
LGGLLSATTLGTQSEGQDGQRSSGGQDSPDGEAGALGGGLEQSLDELGPDTGSETDGQAQEGAEQP